ncbi:MAG: pilus assembly protein PilM [Candidatus Omnitrophica bacterium]|nr:pilus assembly protein PilM [Candidatus Omnitrophota bacterium]
MKNTKLGIYLDSEGLALAEIKDKDLVFSRVFSFAPQEVGSPERIKSLIEGVFNELGVDSKDAYVGISDVNSIFRFLEMPYMKAKELELALPLEAEKYMPFKIEEIAWDFKEKKDFRERKTKIAFTGVKSELVSRFLEIFQDLGIEVKSVESASFAAVGALTYLNKISRRDKSFSAFLISEDSGEITIFDDNFPYFCRHTKFSKDGQGSLNIGKIVDELRITLDYYRRERGKKSLEKLFLLGKKEICSSLLAALQELEIAVEIIALEDFPKPINTVQEFKAFSLALRDVRPALLTFDLLREKKKSQQETLASLVPSEVVWDPRTFIYPLIIGVSLFFGILFLQARKETSLVVEAKKLEMNFVKTQPPDEEPLSLQSLENKDKKLDFVWKEVQKNSNPPKESSAFVALLCGSITEGMWFDDLTLRRDTSFKEVEVSVRGKIYLSDAQKERQSLDDFVAAIKSADLISKMGLKVTLVSIEQRREREYDVTTFALKID